MRTSSPLHFFPPKMKWWAFLFYFLLAAPLNIGSSDRPAKTDDETTVSLSEGQQGSHLLEGRFFVEASSITALAVLTDYDHMSKFVSSVISSRTVLYKEKHCVIEQVMSGEAGIFRKRIRLLLEVENTVPEWILFRDISHKSFKLYAGSWNIMKKDSHLEINYKLEAKPNFFSPDFLTNGAFKRNVETLLKEVKKEIQNRTQEEIKNNQ